MLKTIFFKTKVPQRQFKVLGNSVKVVKGKGEKENIPIQMQFQSIPRRDKKALLSEQCTEIEENNRMGNASDLLKKIRDNEGTFHAKIGTIKDRNGMDLTEADDVKKRWHEYTELYKKS